MAKLFILLIVGFLWACNNNQPKAQSTNLKTKTINPSNYEVYEMPPELREISGITFINDQLVAAIEDEDGILYFYDLAQKKVVRTFKFGEPGDYEDLVRVNNEIYILESNGTIFEITNFASAKPKVNQYKTILSEKNNMESLAYQASNHSLLLAVKNKNLNKDKSQKDIYRFSLNTKTLTPEPAYHIKLNAIEDRFKGDKLEESSKKLLKLIGNENLNEVIKPSSMTIYPPTGELYILSSINKMIVVLSKDDQLVKIIPFKGKDFIQPEGIAFNSKGELFISNEGRKNLGNIIKIKQ